MNHIRCPDRPAFQHIPDTKLFLAGGITGCKNWQDDMVKMLESAKRLTVLNPRRLDFNTDDKEMSVAQIKWEKKMLDDSDAISFWFPKETVCPITLFELGYRLGRHQSNGAFKTLYVGCDPEYTRRLDVEIQISLTHWAKEITIVSSVEALAAQVLDRCVCRYQNAK